MIITIASVKGGTGKSLIASLISSVVNNALFIDCDPQGTLSIYFEPDSGYQKENLYTLLSGSKEESLYSTNGNFIIPSDIRLSEVKNTKTRQKAILDISKKFDITIIDTIGAISPLLELAISVSDLILCPVLPDKFSFIGIDHLEMVMKKCNKDNLKIIPNRFKKFSFKHKEILNLLKSKYEVMPFISDKQIYHEAASSRIKLKKIKNFLYYGVVNNAK